MSSLSRRVVSALVTAAVLCAPKTGAAENPPAEPHLVMDYGPFISATINAPLPGGNTTTRALAIKVGPNGEGTMVFDTELMRWAAGSVGGFIDFRGVAFDGAFETNPSLKGDLVFGNNRERGWWDGDLKGGGLRRDFGDPRENGRGTLPKAEAAYRGLYLNGKQTVLSYTIGTTPVLESPGLLQLDGAPVLTRTLQIGATSAPLWVLVANVNALSIGEKNSPPRDKNNPSRPQSITITPTGAQTVAGLIGGPPGTRLHFVNGRVLLNVPPLPSSTTITLALARLPAEAAARFDSWLASLPAPPDPKPATQGGAARWPETSETRGRLGTSTTPDGAYAVDTLTAPTDNPYKAWLRFTAFDFFADGRRAAIATLSGDVWIVSGIDATLERLTWKRFATGLFQPLGLRIVNDEVFIHGRDQITRLRDLNGDGEADFYECFNNDIIVTPNFHEFAYDLQTDSKGNFYFTKGHAWAGGAQQHLTPHHGILARVSPDGKKFEVLAHGLRQPNGLAIGPADQIIVGDNEGTWVPASRLSFVTPGAFLGVPDTAGGKPVPDHYGQPLLWLPKSVDNSCGSQAWVPDDRWGPFKGAIVHTSYGSCGLFLVMPERVGGRDQGAAMRFPLNFETGIMRPRFNPADGQLYVCGLKGWQTSAGQETAFQRVRFTGKPAALPLEFHVRGGEIAITFTTPLDRLTAENSSNARVNRWNYKWTEGYGSPEFSLRNPAQEGHDPVRVDGARLSPDGRTLTLQIPSLAPVMQMEIKLALKTSSGQPVNCTLYGTIARVP